MGSVRGVQAETGLQARDYLENPVPATDWEHPKLRNTTCAWVKTGLGGDLVISTQHPFS